VGDALNRLVKLLDQLLPFLETAPPWLRMWLYALIVLNFVTIAVVSVSYLISKQNGAQAGTFQHFSIDSPVESAVIPLGETEAWMLSGKFPVITPDQNTKYDIGVEVLRLPGREKVPQNGSARISTALGAWRFESAKFVGAGSYEVLVTAAMGNTTDFRSVRVSCTDKSTAYRQTIMADREQRGAPPIAWAKAAPEFVQRLEAQFGVLQNQFYQHYLVEHDLTQSLETVNVALNAVEPLLPAIPDDYNLQTFRAYMLKNYAMIMRDMGRQEDANRSLEGAAKMFSAVYEQNPNDASVWNGLGSVALLRGDPQMALQYIDQALFLQPGYPEAVQDRELALAAMKTQAKAAAAAVP
jgi:Flp pilus assembly protein TadD